MLNTLKLSDAPRKTIALLLALTTALGRCGYGPRLPLLVVSPWARRNFVDHSVTDQIQSFVSLKTTGLVDSALARALSTASPVRSARCSTLRGNGTTKMEFSSWIRARAREWTTKLV